MSLAAQRAKVTAYAELYELELVEVIVNAGERAKSLDRPGLTRALAMLKADQADALLVVKLDRLTRSVVHLGELIERYFASGKWALMSVGESIDTRSAGGRLVLNILAAYRSGNGRRSPSETSVAMRHKADRGEYTGGHVPLGHRLAADGEHLEPEPQEAAMVARTRALIAKGSRSGRCAGRWLRRASGAGPGGSYGHHRCRP